MTEDDSIMNETIKSILSRRSVRSYENKPVEGELIDILLECGKYAPSAVNMQPWHFTVVESRKVLDEITAAAKARMLMLDDEYSKRNGPDPLYDTFRTAPMAIFVSGMKKAKYGEPDCANAVENMALAAHSLGLGSCIIASFRTAFTTEERDRFLKMLEIPDGYEPYFALALGYPKTLPSTRAPRRVDTVNYYKGE